VKRETSVTDDFLELLPGRLTGNQTFQRLLEGLSDADRQRVLRVATEYGISGDDPAWVALAATERGLLALEQAIPAIGQEGQRAAAMVRAALDEARHAFAEEAEEAKARVSANMAEALVAISGDVALTAAQKERARWLSLAWVAAVLVVAMSVGLGWWLGRSELDSHVALVKAELPAIAAWAKDFDTWEKRERAFWALSEQGATVYRVAQLNENFSQWIGCNFGREVGYTRQEGAYTICYPASKGDKRVVAGMAIARR
jgi:hypothetical protein